MLKMKPKESKKKLRELLKLLPVELLMEVAEPTKEPIEATQTKKVPNLPAQIFSLRRESSTNM
jgi:hypothetical protein